MAGNAKGGNDVFVFNFNSGHDKIEDFGQAGEHWRSLGKDGQAYLIKALSSDLNQVTDHGIKLRQVSYFYKADRDYGTQLAQATHFDVNEVAALATKEMSH